MYDILLFCFVASIFLVEMVALFIAFAASIEIFQYIYRGYREGLRNFQWKPCVVLTLVLMGALLLLSPLLEKKDILFLLFNQAFPGG